MGRARARDRATAGRRDTRSRGAAHVRGGARRWLQATARLRGARRTAAHRVGKVAQAGAARRVLGRSRNRRLMDEAESSPRAASTLSERESIRLVARYGIAVVHEERAPTPEGAVTAADALGYPVVVKLHGDAIAHKSERGLVRLGLIDAAAVLRA